MDRQDAGRQGADIVRLRVFRAWGGICYLSGRKIEAGEPWHIEHATPLSMGGEHREQNLRPALIDPHREKSKREATSRAKADRVSLKHFGIKKPSGRLRSRGFTKKEKPDKIPVPPRRPMYE